MKHPTGLLIATVLLSSLLAACGRAELPQVPRELGTSHATMEIKSLTETIQEHQQSQWVDECDRATFPLQLEIAQALDSRREALNLAAPQSAPAPAGYKRVALGSIYAFERSEPGTARPGWIRWTQGWKSLHARFMSLKGPRVSVTDADWIAFQSSVYGQVLDDKFRLGYGQNAALDPEDVPSVIELRDRAAACLASPTCETPAMSDALASFAQGNRFYREGLAHVAAGSDRGDKRERLKGFLDGRLGIDAGRFEFVPERTVKRLRGGVLRLPLVAGPLAGAEEQLGRYIESVWSQPGKGLRVKVEWVGAEVARGAFSFLLGEQAGARSYISWDQRQVTLFPGAYDLAIAHEIGHVLGLKDNYFNVWRPERCEVDHLNRPDDIMSNIDTGGATPEAWARFRSAYR